MWIAKGTLLGIWLFSFGMLGYSFWSSHRIPGQSGMFDIRLYAMAFSNPSFWLALVACLAIGLIIARSWPGKPILWIGLAITELVPVGFVVLILVLVAKLKAMAR